MSRNLRFIPKQGTLVEVTCRTVQSRLLLTPRPDETAGTRWGHPFGRRFWPRNRRSQADVRQRRTTCGGRQRAVSPYLSRKTKWLALVGKEARPRSPSPFRSREPGVRGAEWKETAGLSGRGPAVSHSRDVRRDGGWLDETADAVRTRSLASAMSQTGHSTRSHS
jgi:hypothetical protein